MSTITNSAQNDLHVARLRYWAEFVESIPSEEFDLSIYATIYNGDIESGEDYEAMMAQLKRMKKMRARKRRGEIANVDAFNAARECGFAGCAIGWLPLAFPDDFKWKKSAVICHTSAHENKSAFGTGSLALIDYFGLPYSMMRRIVLSGGYPWSPNSDPGIFDKPGSVRPQAVAARIRAFANLLSIFGSHDKIPDARINACGLLSPFEFLEMTNDLLREKEAQSDNE